MNIKEQILEWQKNDFVKTLEQMGIGTGAKVVDFGCAVGNYTFSAAYAIGDEGSVYAIDCNLRALESIKSESEQRQIENIVPLRTEKNNKIPLDTASVDMVMIYDLIHDLGNQKTQILLESRRILKEGGILSIAPFHMNEKQIFHMAAEIEKMGFSLPKIYEKQALHFEMHRYFYDPSESIDMYEKGNIYNFTKV